MPQTALVWGVWNPVLRVKVRVRARVRVREFSFCKVSNPHSFGVTEHVPLLQTNPSAKRG